MLSSIKQAPLLQLFSGKIEVVGVKTMDSKLTLRFIMSSLTPLRRWSRMPGPKNNRDYSSSMV